MALEIQENVRYRIQNVDAGTFLEQRNRSSYVMRPQKDNDSLKQQASILCQALCAFRLTIEQWTFVNVSANRDANVPTYVIRNVSSNEFMNAEKLNTTNTPHVGNVSPQSSSAPVPHKLTAKWRLPASHNSATRGGNFF